MPEVLMHARGRGIPGDGDWDQGDIVAIEDDGHPWGRKEDKRVWLAQGNSAEAWTQTLVVLKVTGITTDDLRATGILVPRKEVVDQDGEGPQTTGKRLWEVVMPEVELLLVAELVANGYAEVSWAAAKPWLRNRLTGERLP